MKHRIETINLHGTYFPWVFQAYRHAEHRELEYGETQLEAFAKEHKCKMISYGSAVIAIEFENEGDATMFRLKFL